jgi:hypothetical protein
MSTLRYDLATHLFAIGIYLAHVLFRKVRRCSVFSAIGITGQDLNGS